MSKHTPGPWIFENRDGDHPLNDQNGWGCDGLWAVNGEFILGGGQGWDGTYQGPTKANARLIAAAPEMFELLYKTRNHIDKSCRECESKAIVPEIDALLDKIEGGRDDA